VAHVTQLPTVLESVLPAHPRVYPPMELTIPGFVFPVEVGSHLLTTEGWIAELAWYIEYALCYFDQIADN